MSAFELHDPQSAPPRARAILDNIEGAWGTIPNLHRLLAESPPTLETYGTAFAAFESSSFSPQQKQLVYLAISVANDCGYCTRAHDRLARATGLDAETVAAVRAGDVLADPALEALRRYTTAIVTHRGQVGRDDTDRFLAAGHTRAQVLEVVLAVAVKTISNYVDHVAGVPIDAFLSDKADAPD